MKKVTLVDLKEVIKMHKFMSAYYDDLLYFNKLLKIEITRRTVKIEDKESVILGQISDDIFKEELPKILRPNELPKPSFEEIEEHIESCEQSKPTIESKQISVKTEPIERVERSVPTAVEIEMIKLKELPVEAVMWLRLNPMLAKKAMCHMNPDLKPSLVGNNIVDLGWVRNPKDAKILEKPIEDRVLLWISTNYSPSNCTTQCH